MDKQQTEIGLYVSAVLLAVGVFLPLTQLAIVGEVSYRDVAEVEAYLVVLLAIAGIVFSVAKPRLTLLAPVGVWVVLLFPAIEEALKSPDGGLLSQISSQSQRILREFAVDLLPDLVSNIADFHWGGFVFFVSLTGFSLFSLLRTIKG